MPGHAPRHPAREGFPHVFRPARPNAASHLAPQASSSCPCDGEQRLDLPLARLHGRTVAILLKLPAQTRVLRGRGEFRHDPDLGGVLCIRTYGAGQAMEWLFVERAWEGVIRSGWSLGCDFLVCLQSVPASPTPAEAI
jgi:hypothetical protein